MATLKLSLLQFKVSNYPFDIVKLTVIRYIYLGEIWL